MNLWEYIEISPDAANVHITSDEFITMPKDKALLVKNAVNEYLVMDRRNCTVYDNVIQLRLFALESLDKKIPEQLSFWSIVEV